jgi:hypothetical protein
MTTASNSYAEKVYAEHPIGLWTLDESVDYVSPISSSDRDMENLWVFKDKDNTVLTSAIESYIDVELWPIEFPLPVFDSVANKVIVPDVALEEDETVKITSPVLAQESDFDITVATFAVGAYFYTFGKNLSVTFGVEYTDSLSTTQRLSRTLQLFSSEQWEFVSETFELPSDFTNMKMFFDVSYDGLATDYYFLIHGISMGQWAEQFHSKSLGITLIDINDREVGDSRLPVTIDSHGVEANSYGLRTENGYYLSSNQTLRAVTSGLPMVYGAGNSTVIKPNIDGLPSLIVPGNTFMNENGQYTDLTLEMWLKIQSSATTQKRIVGPIASEDGLYVNDAFLILKIGENFGSYYIAEWDRPMLVAIRLGANASSLIINGEEVISLSFNTADLSFPEKTVTIDGVDKDQDWIGFYAYEDVPRVEVDCIGIYPYLVPNIVEKRRWVYGQGVATAENIKGSDIKSTVVFDYPVSGYSKNYSYPDIGRWAQGINENLIAENSYLGLPAYTLPEFRFDNRTYEEWFEDVKDDTGIFGTSMTLRPQTDSPENSWESTNGYILFPSINMMAQETKAFYAVFEPDETNDQRQILFYLENDITKEILEVYLQGETIIYTFKYLTSGGVVEEEVITSVTGEYKAGTFLFVGIDIEKFTDYFGGRIITFFGSRQNIKIYVGGSREFQNTYSGKIYRVGFCTARNLAKISTVFGDNGIAASANNFENNADSIKDGGTLFRSQNTEGSFVGSFDPITAGNAVTDPPTTYWEEMLNGGDAYFGNLNTAFDEIIDGGSVLSLLIETVLGHVASYTLVPKTFLGTYMLDIAVNGYWQDYVPLSYFAKYTTGEDNQKYYDLDFIQFNIGYPAIFKFLKNGYDTSQSIIKTYVSFQPLSMSSTIQPNYYANTELAPGNNVVEPGDDWLTTKYEVVDDMVIYPPPNIDFQNVAMVLHIEVVSDGIMENPIKIQTLQLASQVLNPFSPNPIGTKFGTQVYPYRRSGGYYDYKGRNPFTIYKGSTPYLYLTGTSGIRLREDPETGLERGISIPINRSSAPFYRVSAFQAAIRYDGETFPDKVTEIAEIYAKSASSNVTKTIKLYMVPDSNQLQRGKIYPIDGDTGLPQDGVVFYVNGIPTLNPVINLRTWTLLSILFNEPLQFDGNPGALRITGPLMFDNVSQYQSTQLDETSRTVYRRWSGILGDNEKWYNWYDSGANPEFPRTGELRDFSWRDVLFISTDSAPVVDGETIYQKYTGTDRIIVDTDAILKLDNYRYTLYTDILWRSNTVTPV